ncbi:MAG: hypothetical protein AAB209_00450 [Bacteroidota bacterium]
MRPKQIIIITVHAIIGWVLCGAIIAVGRANTTMENTLLIHAVGAPTVFGGLSFVYFKKFNFTTPVQTAIIFLSFVVFMDVFVVALLVEKSFEMFASILGTWIPFALIFVSTYLTGVLSKNRSNNFSEHIS